MEAIGSAMTRRRSPVTARVLAAAALCAVLGVLPIFLTGALAVFIRQDLRFSSAQLGLALSSFYVSSTLSAVPAGWISQRFGGRRSMIAAAGIGCVSLIGIGMVSRRFWHLVAFLAVGGIGNAMAQPAASISLARLVRPARRGLAFGLKQASAPAATLVAGAAVPAVGLTLGWRWAYAIGVVITAVFLAILPRRSDLKARVLPAEPQGPAGSSAFVLLAGAVTLSVASASALAAFFVTSAVEQGWSPAVAGTWLAIASAAAVVARIAFGWLADTRTETLGLVATLMGVGACGMWLLGDVSSFGSLAAGALVAFSAGWGWPGVFQLAVVQQRANAPGQAMGVVMTGMFLGGVLGPAVFGLLVDRSSLRLAWSIAAAAMLAGAGLLLVGKAVIGRATPAGDVPRSS